MIDNNVDIVRCVYRRVNGRLTVILIEIRIFCFLDQYNIIWVIVDIIDRVGPAQQIGLPQWPIRKSVQAQTRRRLDSNSYWTEPLYRMYDDVLTYEIIFFAFNIFKFFFIYIYNNQQTLALRV